MISSSDSTSGSSWSNSISDGEIGSSSFEGFFGSDSTSDVEVVSVVEHEADWSAEDDCSSNEALYASSAFSTTKHLRNVIIFFGFLVKAASLKRWEMSELCSSFGMFAGPKHIALFNAAKVSTMSFLMSGSSTSCVCKYPAMVNVIFDILVAWFCSVTQGFSSRSLSIFQSISFAWLTRFSKSFQVWWSAVAITFLVSSTKTSNESSVSILIFRQWFRCRALSISIRCFRVLFWLGTRSNLYADSGLMWGLKYFSSGFSSFINWDAAILVGTLFTFPIQFTSQTCDERLIQLFRMLSK